MPDWSRHGSNNLEILGSNPSYDIRYESICSNICGFDYLDYGQFVLMDWMGCTQPNMDTTNMFKREKRRTNILKLS